MPFAQPTPADLHVCRVCLCERVTCCSHPALPLPLFNQGPRPVCASRVDGPTRSAHGNVTACCLHNPVTSPAAAVACRNLPPPPPQPLPPHPHPVTKKMSTTATTITHPGHGSHTSRPRSHPAHVTMQWGWCMMGAWSCTGDPVSQSSCFCTFMAFLEFSSGCMSTVPKPHDQNPISLHRILATHSNTAAMMGSGLILATVPLPIACRAEYPSRITAPADRM